MTDAALESYDTNARVNPPLRNESDREAIVAGLADGTIDAIATDHAPHAFEEKDVEFAFAPPGLVGLETALAVTVSVLVRPGHMTLSDAIDRLSTAPARILGLHHHGGPIEKGAQANLVAFDPQGTWLVEPDEFVSKSRNTPFGGAELTGRVVHTFFKGAHVVHSGRVDAGVGA